MIKGITKVGGYISTVLFAIVFVTFVVAVTARYVFGAPITWADELSILLFSSLIFFASAVHITLPEQIRFEVLFDLLPPQVARAVAAVSMIAFGLIFLAAVWPCFTFATFMFRMRTPGLNVPYFYVYAAFPFFLLVVSVRLLWSGVRIALGKEQPE